jgi:hypothetical protein
MHDSVVTCFKLQFNFCLLFIWLSNITPKTVTSTRSNGHTRYVRDLQAVAHRDIPGGGSWNIADRIKGLLRSVYKGEASFSHSTETNSNRLILFFSVLCTVASLPCHPFVRRAGDQGRAVSLNHRRRFDDLHGCRRIRFLGSASRTSARVLLQHSWKSLSKSAVSVYRDDGLMVRSVVDSCFMR